jgi:hypothetical protein
MPPSSSIRSTCNAALFALGCAAAHSCYATNYNIAVVDASRANASAIVYSVAPVRKNASSFFYLRLSPPISTQFECCLVVKGKQKISRDVAAVQNASATKTKWVKAALTKRGELPFIGIGLSGKRPELVSENDHSFVLKPSPSNVGEIRIQHCVTTETFHVRAIDVATSKETLRYSLPLGMDVEPTCNDQIMPPLAR